MSKSTGLDHAVFKVYLLLRWPSGYIYRAFALSVKGRPPSWGKSKSEILAIVASLVSIQSPLKAKSRAGWPSAISLKWLGRVSCLSVACYFIVLAL